MTLIVVMAELFPAIHDFAFARRQGVHARHKAGHDEGNQRSFGYITLEEGAGPPQTDIPDAGGRPRGR
jgi:hypothetical protein